MIKVVPFPSSDLNVDAETVSIHYFFNNIQTLFAACFIILG